MDTKDLLKADLAAVEKRGTRKKDRDMSAEEKQKLQVAITEKENARAVVQRCCSQCSNAGLYNGRDTVCSECFAMYNQATKRFWLARYRKIK